MTRKEIMEWGQYMADKVFHGKHKEVKVTGFINSLYRKLVLDMPFHDILTEAGFKVGDKVEITIKKI